MPASPAASREFIPAEEGSAVLRAPERTGVPVQAINNAGQLVSVDSADVASGAAAEEGIRVATPEDLRKAALEEKYGGVGGALGAVAVGGARGLSARFSDAAAVAAFGKPAAEYIEGVTDVHPGLALGSEVGTGVASLFVPGAGEATIARGLARGATAIPRGIAALGGLAERGAARLAGTGAEGLLGRVAQRGAAMGAQAATEGALYNVGNQISEDSLGDHEITAERLFTAAGKGALFGAGLGGVLGAGSAALGHAAEGLAGRIGRAIPEGGLESAASRQSYEALGGTGKDFEKLGRDAAGREARREAVGEAVRKEVDIPIAASRQERATLIAQKADEVGAELGAMRKELDASTHARPSISDFTERVGKEVLEPLTQKLGGKGIIREVSEHLADIEALAGERPTFEKLWEIKADLAKRAFKGPPTPSSESLGKVAKILEDELTTAGDRASQELGTSFSEKYTATKDLFGNLAKARDIAEKAATRGAGRATFGLTDTLAAASGVNLGGILGAVAHGSVGGLIGAAGGAAFGVANKMIREHGNQAAAYLLDKAAQLQAVQRAAGKVDTQLVSGVKGILERKAVDVAEAVVPKVRSRAETERNIAGVVALATNPDMLADRTQRAFGPTTAAPKVAAAFGATSFRAVNFLASKAPKMPDSGNLLQPQFARPKVSDTALSKFNRYQDALEHPLSILEDAKHGKLSREGIEAIKAVLPKTYEQIRTEVQKQLPDLKSPLSWEQQKQLAILLDMPTNATLTPEFTAAMQAVKEAPAPESQASSDPLEQQGGRRPIKLENDFATESERIAAP